MKTKHCFLLASLVTATVLGAGETALAPSGPPSPSGSACCAAEKPTAGAPCCAALKPAAALSARSLYQLDARWTDDRGDNVSLDSLRGRPVVLAMFFASCEYACPVLIDDLKRLRAALPVEVRTRVQIVLVTFDVARDSPAALAAFRQRMGLDANWTLLRGEATAVQDLAMLLGVKYKQDARGQFAHSNLFTILNSAGEIAHQHAGLMGDISPAAKVVANLAP